MAMRKKECNPVDRIVGQNVRRLRMLKSMSQEKLGDALGVTFQQVQKYEKGANRIGGSRMVQIAVALDCTTADLFDGTAGLGTAYDIPSDVLNDPIRLLGETRRGIELSRCFIKLSERTQNRIVDLIAELADD